MDETLDSELQGEAVVASASIPMIFKPTDTINNRQLVDGYLFENLNLLAAINKCREVVTDDKDIQLDVVLDTTDPTSLPEYKPSRLFNSLNIKNRLTDF